MDKRKKVILMLLTAMLAFTVVFTSSCGVESNNNGANGVEENLGNSNTPENKDEIEEDGSDSSDDESDLETDSNQKDGGNWTPFF